MEVIVIEKAIFEQTHQELEQLIGTLQSVVNSYKGLCLQEKWLDTQEVCLMLKGTARLQRPKNFAIFVHSTQELFQTKRCRTIVGFSKFSKHQSDRK
ncbi:DNA-binding protein [Capnocytophaga cynodegmi]|uniref:DNA-binding protein n=1 Tax=Capnocytophaga cynodegmi TaxID=28189 RepID=UPI0020FFF7BA|nr:DNA-binding protein [Capnocytophaga cynodegmi]